MITLAVAWYARSRREFDEYVFMMTGLFDFLSVVLFTAIVSQAISLHFK